MMDAEGVFHSSTVFVFSDVGPLKAVMRLAANAIARKFWFQQLLRKRTPFADMSVISLLGSGTNCSAWEFGNDDGEAVAVVVAETPDACSHLLHSYDVFTKVATSLSALPLKPPHYTPMLLLSEDDKVVCVFAQVGMRWSASSRDLGSVLQSPHQSICA